MKRIIGMTLAVVVVVFQVGVYAAWRTEPEIYLAPIDAPAPASDIVHEHV